MTQRGFTPAARAAYEGFMKAHAIRHRLNPWYEPYTERMNKLYDAMGKRDWNEVATIAHALSNLEYELNRWNEEEAAK